MPIKYISYGLIAAACLSAACGSNTDGSGGAGSSGSGGSGGTNQGGSGGATTGATGGSATGGSGGSGAGGSGGSTGGSGGSATGGSGGSSTGGSGGSTGGAAGTGGGSSTGGTAGSSTGGSSGAGGSTTSGTAGSGTGGAAGSGTGGAAGSGTGGTAGSTMTDAGTATPGCGSGTTLTGKLNGAAILPTVCSQMITYSGETIIYLSSAKLTCAQMQTSRWLGSAVAGSQVVEIIIKGDPVVGTNYPAPPGEVNYAIGGKSSATEVTASSGTIKYTLVDLQKTVEGTVMATSTDGSTISGTFHAEYCVNGQEF